MFKKNLNWLEKEYPKMSFISAVIHYDEKKPHMHVCAIPLAVKEKKLTQREVLKELTKLNLSDKKSDKEFIKKFQNEHKYTATTLSAKKYFDGKSSLYELQNKWFEYQKELFKDKNIEILRRKHEGRRYIKNIEVFKAEAQKIADEMTEELKIEDIQIPEAKVHLNILKFIKKSLFGEQKVGRTENKIFLSQDEEINNYFFNIFEFQAQIENYDDIAAQIEEKNKTNSVKQNKISDKIKNFISNLSDLFNQGFYELMDFVKTKVKNFSINKQIEEKIPEIIKFIIYLPKDFKKFYFFSGAIFQEVI